MQSMRSERRFLERRELNIFIDGMNKNARNFAIVMEIQTDKGIEVR